eukprot:5444588-Alexandrium_andersonii.AAC.1
MSSSPLASPVCASAWREPAKAASSFGMAAPRGFGFWGLVCGCGLSCTHGRCGSCTVGVGTRGKRSRLHRLHRWAC